MTNMVDIINYIMNNFIWVLIGVIVILLAIIGRYADKTNFGEGKKIVKVKKKEKDLVDEIEVERKEEPVVNDLDEMLNPKEEPKEENKIDTDSITVDLGTDNKEEVKEEPKDLTTEEFLKSDDLDLLLPKKGSLNDDLLQELDDINLDFKNKKSTSIIPDLDDVDLPSIKKKKTTADIWK